MSKTKEQQLVIQNPHVSISKNENVEVIRILQEGGLIRIDFLCKAPLTNNNKGWASMDIHCYIKPVGTRLKFFVTKTCNIPFSPAKHHFKKSGDLLAFSMWFPKPPKEFDLIDIIEKEGGERNWFNFYGVSLKRIERSYTPNSN